MKELISLIVPIFNAEIYLRRCLNSIINQTYKNIEIILINDGSNDNSLQICNEYLEIDNRIRLISKKNEGLSIARQIGIDNCKGTYFCTFDADDYLEPCYVEELVNTILENNGDIALCAKNEFTDDGEITTEFLNKNVRVQYDITDDELKKRYVYICREYQMSDSWNKMYKTSFVRKSKVRFCLPREYNGTDLLFNHSLLLHNPIMCSIDKPLYNYRLTPNSRVRRKNKHLEIGFRVIYENLLSESYSTLQGNRMKKQIMAEYMSMIKYATLDFYEEKKSDDNTVLINGFKEIINSMPNFRMIEKIGAELCAHREIRLFGVLLLTNNARGILEYYQLRELVNKIRGL